MTEAVTPPKVFLCHSAGDKPAVRELYEQLRAAGFDPWLDEANLLGGQDWHLEIRRAIQQTDYVLICLTEASVEKFSYVQREIGNVLDRAAEAPEGRIFVIPTRLEECTLPDRLSAWHCVDLYADDGFERLLRALGTPLPTKVQPPRSFWLASGAWLCGGVVLLTAHLPGLAGQTRLVAMAISLGVSLCVWLGPANRLQKHVRTGLQRLYQRLYQRLAAPRWLTNTLLWLGLCAAVLSNGVLVSLIGVRLQYARLIVRALALETNSDKHATEEKHELIRRAFVMLPARKEAQMLVERDIGRLRNTERAAPFREQARRFLFHPAIMRAIEQAQTGETLYAQLAASRRRYEAFNNPVIWYAGLLFEALDEKNTEESLDLCARALALLATQPGPEAELAQAFFQTNLDQFRYRKNQDPQLKATLLNHLAQDMLKLRNLVERPSTYESLAQTHLWQVACDMLASYALATCRPDNMADQCAEAAHQYRQILRARERATALSDKPLWQRPHEKLRLFHLFRTEGGTIASPNDAPALAIQTLLNHCPDFKQRFREQFLDKESKYKNSEVWLKGTVLDPKAELYIRQTLLNQDWRY